MVKIYSVWSSSLLFCKISLCSYHWSTFWIYKTRTPNTRIIIFNVGMFWIILQWMQIGKIEVEFVMLIIEEAFAWLRWIINNWSLETHEYFNPLSMSLIKHINLPIQKDQKWMHTWNCLSKSAIHILQVMISWRFVNPADLKIQLKWTISTCWHYV